jgi:acetyl esterase
MGNPHALQTTDVVDFRTDQRLSRGTRAFLKALNTPMPPELEKLAPIAARNVLETAQASVNVDYSGIDEREKTIIVDGFQIALNIVRPKGAAGTLPVFVFVHGGGCYRRVMHRAHVEAELRRVANDAPARPAFEPPDE